MNPEWKDAPDWAQWKAQDANGTWCWYETKPIPMKTCWHGSAWGADSMCADPNPDWRDTL